MFSQSAPLLEKTTWLLSGQIGPNEPVRKVRISSSPFTIGRRPDASLTISSPTISNLHAELELRDESLILRDLGSTNGTFVNGRRIVSEHEVTRGDLVQFAQVVFRVGLESEEGNCKTIQDDATDRALALIQFDKLMNNRTVAPHFQPIVEMKSESTIGYEILGRSRYFGLYTPQAMFAAAAVLNLETELSRILRCEGARCADVLPGDPKLFVNTHPAEMSDIGALETSLRELRELAPESQIVLEVHETTVTNVAQIREIRAVLNDLEIGLAYDDFGAGQARLVELVEVPPDYLKFDLKLVKDVHRASAERQAMLVSLVQMVVNLGIAALAEGVESAGEHEVCKQMGFHYAQGFFYGKPALPKTFVN